MKKLILSAILFAAVFTGVKAQQDAAYSMYMFNGLFLNPAYAGSSEAISVMAIYRHQWAGLEGAPKTVNASVHTPFRRDQYAVGLTLTNDRLGLANTFSVTPAFSYRLRIKQSRLCFGVQASFAYYYQNSTSAVLPDNIPDNAFSLNSNLFVPNIGFGVYWYGKRYFAGFSVPHLLPAKLRDKTGVSGYNTTIARVYNHYLFTGGYVFGKEASIVKFRPSILMKWQKGLPKNIPQFDINLALLFVERLWFGVGYRTGGDGQGAGNYAGQSANLFLQFKATPQLQIGYAYDAEISSLRKYNGGTHEIMIGYDFYYNKKRFVTPRFVKYF
ncbi:MAG: type IX secretion system membrane protein PorP/SprF [Bacteroidota bacterium]